MYFRTDACCERDMNLSSLPDGLFIESKDGTEVASFSGLSDAQDYLDFQETGLRVKAAGKPEWLPWSTALTAIITLGLAAASVIAALKA
jgi:hypothetical protein